MKRQKTLQMKTKTLGVKTQAPKLANDEEDLEEEDEKDGNMTCGTQRYENMIKSMMARIEFNQALAPVQTYGRHQAQAAQRKKKAKKNKEGGGTTENGGEEFEVKYDDQFYDLDDDFIDDGEVEMAAYDDGHEVEALLENSSTCQISAEMMEALKRRRIEQKDEEGSEDEEEMER